jgi:hypothetical protein
VQAREAEEGHVIGHAEQVCEGLGHSLEKYH